MKQECKHYLGTLTVPELGKPSWVGLRQSSHSPGRAVGAGVGALWEGWGCWHEWQGMGREGWQAGLQPPLLARPAGDLARLLQALNRPLAPSLGDSGVVLVPQLKWPTLP